jgi:uncharacterized protein (TIGR00266 family)
MSSAQWYIALHGHQIGPVPASEVESQIRSGSITAETFVYTTGMANWTPLKDVPVFAAEFKPGAAPPALPTPPGRVAHEIDFTIQGAEMQFVEVQLDPGESAIAEAGVMMYMTDGIEMQTVFGDGTEQPGVMGKLVGAGKRLLTGESLFMTVFTSRGHKPQRVAFAAPYAGHILPMDLTTLGGELICQKDSFLCAAKGVSIGIAFQKKIGVGLFGGEGFIMQRLQGDGLTFLHAGGTVHVVDLEPGEKLRVDTGCLVALQPTVDYDVQFVGGIKTALFGGEGLFFATLSGPGRVWLQSLPLSRLADRIYKAAPQTGGKRVGEGSVLDRALGLGNLIDGR